MGKMFPFITGICNPLCGECDYQCEYCWARELCKLHKMKKYVGAVRIDEKEIKNPTNRGRQFKEDDYIFLVDMLDIFGSNVSTDKILQVLTIPQRFPKTRFLILTKNPIRYAFFLKHIPLNCTLGATIESNRYYPAISKAPEQMGRILSMEMLRRETNHKMLISVEPILDFDWSFVEWLSKMQPCTVAVGCDNHRHKLPEPPLKKIEQFIKMLENAGVEVIRKTIRRAWYEQ